MEKFGKSQSILRTEDNRFLTGKGRYIDDSSPSSSLYAYFFDLKSRMLKLQTSILKMLKKLLVYTVFLKLKT